MTREKIFAGLLLACSLSAAPVPAADDPAEELLRRMAAEGSNFNPETLLQEGVPGLTRLLDELFPQTAGPLRSSLSGDQAAKLLAQLGEASFKIREEATRKLIEEGEPFRELVEQRAKDADPEISGRAREILTAWQAKVQARPPLDATVYVNAFGVYMDRLKDQPALLELSGRIRAVLEKGPLQKGQRNLIEYGLAALAKTGDDRVVDPLIPLLKHKDYAVAVMVTRSIGSHKDNRYFPRFLLEALKSDREFVVAAALDWTPNCWDPAKANEVRRLVTAVFEGSNEKLKFQACFPMMHSYGDRRAIDYLLSQANNPDKARAVRAMGWIGDACNSGKQAFPELLATLVPLLKSEDKEIRRRAAYALGTYQGTEVVDNLIPLLADSEDIIRQETSSKLLAQQDKTMLKTRLADAAEKSENETVRAKAKELLEKLPAAR